LTLGKASPTRFPLLLRASLLAAGLSGPLQPLHAQGTVEADLKSALVYNFAQFTEWEARDPDPARRSFTICFAGAEMSNAFAQIASKSIGERRIAARPIPAEGPYDGCQVVYWHDGNLRRAQPGKAGQGVLTIGSGAEFIARGGMIEMHLEDARVVFSINVDSAREAGLRFSSKLLRLAKNVSGSAQ
jgi:hypothetical protein